jgi:hypothetical protein
VKRKREEGVRSREVGVREKIKRREIEGGGSEIEGV